MPRKPVSKPRQRPIPVTASEREVLDDAKMEYERRTGQKGDWGEFLRGVTLLGLAALGVYLIAKVIKAGDTSTTVRCPHCMTDFVLANPEDGRRVIDVACPQCESDLVVNLVKGGADQP